MSAAVNRVTILWRKADFTATDYSREVAYNATDKVTNLLLFIQGEPVLFDTPIRLNRSSPNAAMNSHDLYCLGRQPFCSRRIFHHNGFNATSKQPGSLYGVNGDPFS